MGDTISTKLKITSIVIASLLLLSALAGGIIAIVLNEINKGDALTNGNAYSIGNLIDGDEINAETAKKLLGMFGENTAGVERNSAQLRALNTNNANNPIVFEMGEVNGNSVYWQVVYQTGNIVTIWMTAPYTADYFNYSSGALYNPSLAGATIGQYANYGDYSHSVLRDIVQGIYEEMSANYSVLDSFIVSPQDAVTNLTTGASGINWQYDCYSQIDTIFRYDLDSEVSYSNHNGLGSSAGTNYNTATFPDWDETTFDDMFWIPSYYEVFNRGSGSPSASVGMQYFDGGLWHF